MSVIKLTAFIRATPEICFDLSRSVELHLASTARTKEKVVAGRASGLCELGDTITWEAVHFGIRQQLTVQITAMNRPHSFTDEMKKGIFKSFSHVHLFTAKDGGTQMQDIFTFYAPLGLLGKVAEVMVLKSYLARFLKLRNACIKKIAESKEPSDLNQTAL